MEGKYKSLNARWFGCKSKKSSTSESIGDASAEKSLISRGTLVKFQVNRGTNESVE